MMAENLYVFHSFPFFLLMAFPTQIKIILYSFINSLCEFCCTLVFVSDINFLFLDFPARSGLTLLGTSWWTVWRWCKIQNELLECWCILSFLWDQDETCTRGALRWQPHTGKPRSRWCSTRPRRRSASAPSSSSSPPSPCWSSPPADLRTSWEEALEPNCPNSSSNTCPGILVLLKHCNSRQTER